MNAGKHNAWEATIQAPVSSIAASPQVVDFLGSAAFSKAVQAIDMKTGGLVCLKIVKVRRATPRRKPR